MSSQFKSVPQVPSFGLILLAAGMGKRMKSNLPKVLHEIAGKPLISHVLMRVREVNPDVPVAIVVGHGRDQVREMVMRDPELSSMQITWVIQSEQKGTGHAARCAMDSEWGKCRVRDQIPVLVLPGDLPLVSAELIEQSVRPLARGSLMRVVSCHLEDPTGYGRILRRSKKGPIVGIVEEKDASPKQKQIQEVGTSIYLFEPSFLSRSLDRLKPNNAQGEYYLTDLIALAAKSKNKVLDLVWSHPLELKGVNDPWELSQAREIYHQQCVRGWAKKGVQFLHAASVQIDADVKLASGVVIDAGVVLRGKTQIGMDTRLGPHTHLVDVIVDSGVHIKTGTVAEDCRIGANSQVGPNAHLRPGTTLGKKVKIGNFVELKKTTVGDHTSIAHLSYLGDAEVGQHVNIGCGFVTCNFDGRIIQGERKHKTIIEDEVFMGSACQAVAPIRIGRAAYVASGSTLTEDVQADALAIGRSRQVNKAGYAKKLRSNKND